MEPGKGNSFFVIQKRVNTNKKRTFMISGEVHDIYSMLAVFQSNGSTLKEHNKNAKSINTIQLDNLIFRASETERDAAFIRCQIAVERPHI